MLEPVTGTIVAFTSALEIIAACIPKIFAALLTITGGAATIAAMMPPPKKPGLWKIVHTVINILAMNVGRAVNKSTVAE